MRSILPIASWILVGLVPLALHAQSVTDSVASESVQTIAPEVSLSGLDLEFGELLFDETITKVGRDFYAEFFANWINPTQLSNFSISVKERPLPGLGTQLRVFIDDTEVFNRFMQPNQELIEFMAAYAVQLCQSYLINYQEIQAQLQSEDQLGTGIY
jgi:curli production assembly/transport component CsgE